MWDSSLPEQSVQPDFKTRFPEALPKTGAGERIFAASQFARPVIIAYVCRAKSS